jgi:hypothetical protein
MGSGRYTRRTTAGPGSALAGWRLVWSCIPLVKSRFAFLERAGILSCPPDAWVLTPDRKD